VVAPDGREVRVRDRIEVLVKDADDVPWLLYHLVVDDGWTDLHQLELDERGLFHSWAWELDYLGWTIAGVIYRELRRAVPEGGLPTDAREFPPASTPLPEADDGRPRAQPPPRVPLRAPEGSGPRLVQQGNEFFRHTRIRRSREEVEATGHQVTLELEEMTDPAVRVFANPTPEGCAACDFREPCAAMYRGEDATGVLQTAFRPRREEEVTWRLGSRGMLGRGSLPWKPRR